MEWGGCFEVAAWEFAEESAVGCARWDGCGHFEGGGCRGLWLVLWVWFGGFETLVHRGFGGEIVFGLGAGRRLR